MKKMYKKPKTDVQAINTTRLMQGLTVSVNNSGGPGTAGAPGRRGDIIP